jgi:hypothetical protein
MGFPILRFLVLIGLALDIFSSTARIAGPEVSNQS